MIKVGPALVENAELLERERGIPKHVILSSLKEAMLAAYKRYAHLNEIIGYECKLIERTGEIGIYQLKKVVAEESDLELPPYPSEEEPIPEEAWEWGEEDASQWQNPEFYQPVTPSPEATVQQPPAGFEPGAVYDATYAQGEAGMGAGYNEGEEAALLVEEEDPSERYMRITLKDARALKPDAEVGDILEIDVTPGEFGRIAAQSAKQVITQRIREAEKFLIQREFEEKRDQVLTAIVQRIEGRNVIASIGKIEALLPPREQLPGEYYRVGNKLRVYVADLRDSGRVPQIIVSQAHAAMVREIFELEVPEIEDGLVEIKSIAREAGFRTKVAVHSNDPDVDPQGACIGARGSRIQSIVNELKNEKIDIIRWSDDPIQFIVNALAPAKIMEVRLAQPTVQHPNPPARALVIVPDDQLSLAIGREGQNVRLAAKLTGYKLDIKSLSQLHAELARVAEYQQQQQQGHASYDDDDTESPTEAAPAEATLAQDDAPFSEQQDVVQENDGDASMLDEAREDNDDDDTAAAQQAATL
jgi:N utilization substance protein A